MDSRNALAFGSVDPPLVPVVYKLPALPHFVEDASPLAVQAAETGAMNMTFVYDEDGRHVKGVVENETTLFVGSHYEKSGSTVTKYYFAGTSRIAMRKGGTLSYLLSDHLGSTSLTTNASGALISELRYKPWGETRYSNGTTPTKYTYTGQYTNVSDFGLLFYNARWYDPALGRFAQADSIVPGGVQGYDRYAYVNNNPLRYTDPTGHMCSDPEDKWSPSCDGSDRVGQRSLKHGGGGCTALACLAGANAGHITKLTGGGGTLSLETLIQLEIDRRFNPYTGWLPPGFEYNGSVYQDYDYYARIAYERNGYDLYQIAAAGQENPMTEDDWLNRSEVPIEYIYSRGVGSQAPGAVYMLDVMNLGKNNMSNYEANYLDILMETHQKMVTSAKQQYFEDLLFKHGGLQGAWDFLRMNIGVAGPGG